MIFDAAALHTRLVHQDSLGPNGETFDCALILDEQWCEPVIIRGTRGDLGKLVNRLIATVYGTGERRLADRSPWQLTLKGFWATNHNRPTTPPTDSLHPQD